MLVFCAGFSSTEASLKHLPGHVSFTLTKLISEGRLPATNRLHLVIGLTLRDSGGLDQFLQQLYDPASTNYQKFLNSGEFLARFGPTEADYQAVKDFASTNGLTVLGTYGNRQLLDIDGPVMAVESAFHLTLRKFRLPDGAASCFGPDAEPSVDAALPMADVTGLSDYAKPHPRIHQRRTSAGPTAKVGSAPDGTSYLGDDIRRAYVPGTVLTGAGQMVGLMEFDGYFASDILAYAAAAGGGRTNVVIQPILLDGASVTPGYSGIPEFIHETELDIEMAIAMAPGLAKVVVFEAPPNISSINHILNAMVTNSAVKSLTSTFGWTGGPNATTENYFKQMQAQGQSFFNGTGDGDAFGSGSANDINNPNQANYPASSTNITQVGGTVLTMNGAGISYLSETVWNDRTTNAANGGYWGSSGGISTNAMPYWQTNISMAANKGSATNRNVPDVAMLADNVYCCFYDGTNHTNGVTLGTSVATPLWAGLMALINQQATLAGRPVAGFINPAIYAIGNSVNYTNCFHDITSGDNTWPGSPNKFFAVPGYDLCTGLGTPNGSNFINALAGPLVITPSVGSANCLAGGFFTPAPRIFTITNSSVTNLAWSLLNTSIWLNVSLTNGILVPNAATNLPVSLTTSGKNLSAGAYTANLTFTNRNNAATLNVPFLLQLTAPPGFTAVGACGGPFSPATTLFALTNTSGANLTWSMINTSAWINIFPSASTLGINAGTVVNFSLAPAANRLAAGIYAANILFTNLTSNAAMIIPFQLQIGQQIVANGGFELGPVGNNALGWGITDSYSGSGNPPDFVDNGNLTFSSILPHAGGKDFLFGQPGSLALLSQNLATIPGQTYQLSFWLDNDYPGSPSFPQQFLVRWNTNGMANNTVLALTNPPAFTWSNVVTLVTATSTNTTLQFAVRNDASYFGLDDVAVWPIPLPTVMGYARTTNAFTVTWNTFTGLVYQIQFSTNLLQTNWNNLTTNTAVASTMTYTNFTGSDTRRFYRIRRLP